MKLAADIFEGFKDFKSFSDKNADSESTKVLVDEITIEENGSLILIRIKASHFLWKMVRRIVGTLVEVGRGALNEKDIKILMNLQNTQLPHLVCSWKRFITKL